MNDLIDLRSDTVTQPTEAMRRAMAQAVVGDDVYGEDPTVQQLERDSAAMLGKEAALFVSSGTQGNLIAMLTHCPRGSELICGDKAHVVVYEAGGMSALGGIMPRTVKVYPDGHLDLDDIRRAIRPDDQHFPRTRLICLENTQGTMGGMPLSAEYTDAVGALAREHGLRLHIDGARIFNAATALNTSVAALSRAADSVTFCLSKGLCAPVGSVLVGDKAFIAEARRVRKMLGGGMRQAGVLAAAGLIALHEMTKRLDEDHANAAYFAEGLSEIPHIRVESQATNFVMFWLSESAKHSPASFEHAMQAEGVVLRPYPGYTHKYRAVMHYWIKRHHVEHTLAALRRVLA
ncbi:MAG: low-specificity L-threonine aldolase [Anaerolineae bacterium]|nr:low-specificity L-threonine aldolase [Anaerolineae bacterium]MDW8172113.1 low-specificity L-threonine aldolase [Anaerolineae bacterium]